MPILLLLEIILEILNSMPLPKHCKPLEKQGYNKAEINCALLVTGKEELFVEKELFLIFCILIKFLQIGVSIGNLFLTLNKANNLNCISKFCYLCVFV